MSYVIPNARVCGEFIRSDVGSKHYSYQKKNTEFICDVQYQVRRVLQSVVLPVVSFGVLAVVCYCNASDTSNHSCMNIRYVCHYKVTVFV